MNRSDYFTQVEDKLGFARIRELYWAYWLSKNAHRIQKRDSGERYFNHPRGVAVILLTEFGESNFEEQIAALLHDVDEDQFMPADMIHALFGTEIADAIDLLSKFTIVYRRQGVIEKIKKDSTKYYEELTKAPLKVRRVKVADRLHNLRTCAVWPAERRQKYVLETEKFILPIAHSISPQIANLIDSEISKLK